MAEYTIELKDIVESHNIFDFAYPFYDESKRHDFERSFVRHFYFREIGCESVDRFKHYLNDKMNVVFPYYNELFKSASIKYDVLDNYKLTETYERKIENNGKTSGISSTVGQVFDNQENEVNQNKTVENVGNVDTIGKDTTTTTGNKTTEGTTTTENQNIKKYLDTPQGLTDLSDSKYLTNLTQDNASGTQTTEGSEDTQQKTETDTLSNSETTNKETTADNVQTNSSQETKTTSDNNTRTFLEGEQSESYTLTRKGNIGVDTDSDAIEKHNRLQKTLKNIERMFFEECEDLFMLVY